MQLNKTGVFFIFFVLASCGMNQEKIMLDRYKVAGERIFEKKCANCHQKDGSGFRGLYPAITESSFQNRDKAEIICLLIKGSPSISDNKNEQNNPKMPPSNLSDLELAELYTYIYVTYGRKAGLTHVKEISAVRSSCN